VAEHANATLLREGFAMFNRADVEGLSKLIAEDAVQRMPGDNMVSGEYKGRDAILAMYGKLGELTGGTFRAELEELYANDDRVVAIYHGIGQRGDKTLDSRRAIVFQIVGRQIVAVDDISSDIEGDDAFFA
jgi:ketosteroid isomerase-like protein